MITQLDALFDEAVDALSTDPNLTRAEWIEQLHALETEYRKLLEEMR